MIDEVWILKEKRERMGGVEVWDELAVKAQLFTPPFFCFSCGLVWSPERAFRLAREEHIDDITMETHESRVH